MAKAGENTCDDSGRNCQADSTHIQASSYALVPFQINKKIEVKFSHFVNLGTRNFF